MSIIYMRKYRIVMIKYYFISYFIFRNIDINNLEFDCPRIILQRKNARERLKWSLEFLQLRRFPPVIRDSWDKKSFNLYYHCELRRSRKRTRCS